MRAVLDGRACRRPRSVGIPITGTPEAPSRIFAACFLVLSLVGCTDDTPAAQVDGSTGDGATTDDASAMVDGSGTGTDGGTLDMMGPDMAPTSCASIGQACVNGASCCSGLCDATSHVCISPPNVCAPQGSACGAPSDCCSLTCVGGKCGTACKTNGTACAAGADCCSGNCAAGTCQPVVPGACVTLGNKCAAPADCCSKNCQGGLCTPQGGTCNALGDVCFRSDDCCSGSCTIPAGLKAGTCTVANGGGGGNCTQDGEPCEGCSNCCSRVCAPTLTGGHICAPAGGCRPIGEACRQDSDCCGGGNTGLPGANSVTCNIVPGSNPPIGTCSNPNGCDPDGDVCGLMVGNSCGNARHDCCDCLPPKINCCKADRNGVPRCYGGSSQQCPTGYTGKPPCCLGAGQVCAFAGECCNGAACVPDAKGVLRCGNGCQMQGQTCTADGDCCAGLPCNIPKGSFVGKCEPPPAPPTPPDMAMPASDAGAPDMAGQAPPDMAQPKPCSLVGQSCSTTQPCCPGMTCAPPGGVGVCQPGQAGCTCVGAIG